MGRTVWQLQRIDIIPTSLVMERTKTSKKVSEKIVTPPTYEQYSELLIVQKTRKRLFPYGSSKNPEKNLGNRQLLVTRQPKKLINVHKKLTSRLISEKDRQAIFPLK